MRGGGRKAPRLLPGEGKRPAAPSAEVRGWEGTPLLGEEAMELHRIVCLLRVFGEGGAVVCWNLGLGIEQGDLEGKI